MTRYILQRLVSTIPTILGITIVVFMFLRLIPGDPAVAMLGEHATEENVNRIREQFGLNRPVFLDRDALKNGDFAGCFMATWDNQSTAAYRLRLPWLNGFQQLLS